jgi:hypothetical protein
MFDEWKHGQCLGDRRVGQVPRILLAPHAGLGLENRIALDRGEKLRSRTRPICQTRDVRQVPSLGARHQIQPTHVICEASEALHFSSELLNRVPGFYLYAKRRRKDEIL